MDSYFEVPDRWVACYWFVYSFLHKCFGTVDFAWIKRFALCYKSIVAPNIFKKIYQHIQECILIYNGGVPCNITPCFSSSYPKVHAVMYLSVGLHVPLVLYYQTMLYLLLSIIKVCLWKPVDSKGRSLTWSCGTYLLKAWGTQWLA